MVHLLIRLLMVLVFLLTMGDIITTNGAIGTGGAREANPVMAFFMRVFGSKWMIPRLVFGLVSIFVALHYNDNWKGCASLALNCLLLAYVVWNNWKLWRANAHA